MSMADEGSNLLFGALPAMVLLRLVRSASARERSKRGLPREQRERERGGAAATCCHSLPNLPIRTI